MIADKNRIYDGWTRLESGVDGGRSPNLIERNQVASSENLTFRGGRPTPRPGFRELIETLSNPGHGFDSLGREIPVGDPVPMNLRADSCYRNDVFQSIIAYSPHKGEDCLMALIGGRLFKIVPRINTASVTEITVKDSDSPYSLPSVTLRRPPDPGVFTDGAVHDPAHPNIFESASAGFTQDDIQAGLFCPGYAFGFTSISEIISSTKIRTADNFTGSIPATGLSFHVVDIVKREHIPYRNYKWSPIAYMVQADKWLIAQDGNSKAIIFDGREARRSNLEGLFSTLEVPTGTMMAFGMGRLAVVVNDRDVAFGDLYGSHLDKQTDPADSIILFTERNFLAGGFDAAIPFQQGLATGIQFFPQLDTSTGNGQLLVFAERGAASFNLAIDRLLWQTSQFQIIALLTTGMRGHRSIVGANEDLWFRGDDGYRAFRQARSDSWGWAHIPLSTNVGQFLDLDDGELLRFASTIYFDNRMIGTTSPVWNVDPQNAWRGRVYHNGMVVVDFNVLSSFGTKYKPTWEGHWTIGNGFTSSLPDIKVCQLCTGSFGGVTRAFAFGMKMLKDSSGNVSYQNQLYELSFDDKDDFDGSVQWELVSRAFDFSGGEQQTNQFTESELYDADLWISDISQGSISPPQQ